MDDASAELRAAIRRLIAAVRHDAIDVRVQRRDLEVLLAINAQRHDPVVKPSLHPEQR